jgi:hypothetical protein
MNFTFFFTERDSQVVRFQTPTYCPTKIGNSFRGKPMGKQLEMWNVFLVKFGYSKFTPEMNTVRSF